MTKEPKRTLWLIVLVAVVVAIWLLCPAVIIRWYGYPDGAGAYGDIYGACNALFSGLAFAGLIVTIWFQKEELRQNTLELRNSASALSEQVSLMRLSAKLAALPELIKQERQIISHYARLFPGLHQIHTVEQVLMRISEFENGSAEAKAKIEQLKGELIAAKPAGEDYNADFQNSMPDHIRRELDYHDEHLREYNSALPSLKRLGEYLSALETVYREIDAKTKVSARISEVV